MTDYSIGRVSRQSGVKIPTIRYYESIGLIPEPPRSNGGQRRYDDRHMEQLRFIRHGRDLGFGLDDLRTLQALSGTPEQSCEDVDAIARNQLLDVTRKIKALTALKVELRRMISQCQHGSVGECRVIKTLSDHALCQHGHNEN